MLVSERGPGCRNTLFLYCCKYENHLLLDLRLAGFGQLFIKHSSQVAYLVDVLPCSTQDDSHSCSTILASDNLSYLSWGIASQHR